MTELNYMERANMVFDKNARKKYRGG